MKSYARSYRLLTCLLIATAGLLLTIASGQEPAAITFLPAAASSPISAGVAVPAGQALLMTSGTVPPAHRNATATRRLKASAPSGRSRPN
jgi:hypothetical protein